VKIRAPAKVNFGLRVVGKRADGYHLLDTIMLPVSLYDQIHLAKIKYRLDGKKTKPQDSLTVTCDDPSVPGGKKNLAYQAASLLLSRAGIDQPVRISIRKRIPVGAGLGGGSTDAGATLVGLNRLFRLRYTSKQLAALACELGADVPFFIKGVPARARGIGERLTVLKKVPRLWLIILYPNFAVSSAWVYRNFGAKLTKPMVNTSITFSLRDAGKLKKLLVNDLETVAMDRYPRIGLLKQELAREGAVGALMSGSGSSVFGVFRSRRSAADAFRRLRKEEGVQAFLVRVLS
jgi:4-diphosphocytidyl-2-C-methyl-D-erythritol kinase